MHTYMNAHTHTHTCTYQHISRHTCTACIPSIQCILCSLKECIGSCTATTDSLKTSFNESVWHGNHWCSQLFDCMSMLAGRFDCILVLLHPLVFPGLWGLDPVCIWGRKLFCLRIIPVASWLLICHLGWQLQSLPILQASKYCGTTALYVFV